MKYYRILRSLFFFAPYIILCINASCTNPPNSSSVIVVAVVPSQYYLYRCNLNKTFQSGDVVIASQCVGVYWTEIQTCISSTAATTITTCTSVPTAPEGSVKTNIVNNTFSDDAIVYECSNGTSWLSGDDFRISQCMNGNWTIIYDVCEPDLDPPRQCSDVEKLGIKTDGLYNVMPSGKQGAVVKVKCHISANASNNGGGWTVILIKLKDYDINTHSYPPTRPFPYETGVANSDTNFWAGTLLLSQLSRDLNGNLRGMILEITLQDASNNNWRATYGNFSIGISPSYAILSLGTYHGNAGDAMSPLVGKPFQFELNVNYLCWWGATYTDRSQLAFIQGNFLTSNNAFWGTLPLVAGLTQVLNYVQMRVRPIDFDQATTCPPLVGSFPRWSTTLSNIPNLRIPGTNISWLCIQEYLYEGEENGTRTTQGIATCQNDTGKLPFWSQNVTLPCALVCPNDFEINYNGTSCFSASIWKAKDFVDAQLQCEAINSTIATVITKMDSAIADNDTERYFMSYTDRPASSPSRTFLPTLPPIDPNAITCSGQCVNNGSNQKTNPSLECTIIRNNGTYEFTSCNKSLNYMCQLPVRCSMFNQGVTKFFEVKGSGCYAVVNSNSNNIKSIYEQCRNLGAGLAYPTSDAQMKLLTNATIQFYNSTGSLNLINADAGITFGLGLTYINQNWSHGYYLVDDDLYNKPSKDPYAIWQTVTIYGSLFTSANWAAVNLTSSVNNGICHYNGQLDCVEDPPAVINGITSDWNQSYAYSTVIKYSCTLGYFVNGNLSLPINQTVTCFGQIGEWYSPTPFQPCLPVPVCTNSSLIIPPDVIVHGNESSYYYHGQLQFKCPNGTGTDTLSTSQTLNCNLTSASTSYQPVFSFIPDLIKSCTNCIDAVSVENASSTWSNSSTYQMNATVTVNCQDNYQFAFNVKQQNIICTDSGWNYTFDSGCYLACTNNPPTAMSNMSRSVLITNDIGTILHYTCDPSLKFVTTMIFTTITDVVDAICQNGVWINPRDAQSFACVSLCESDPPKAPGNSTYDWDGFSREMNDTVTYACPNGYLWPGYIENLTLTCNGSQWIGLENITFACRQVCEAHSPLLNATTSTTIAFVDETANYTCLPGLGNQTNKATNFSIKCDNTAKWTNMTNFLCEPICFADPAKPPQYAIYDYKNKTKYGAVITYTCPYGSFENQTGSELKQLHSSCVDGNWTLEEPIPSCLTITTPGPTTIPPIILPESNVSYLYPYTTSSYYGDLTTFNSTSGAANGYSVVNGVIGFGSGISLNKNLSQCMNKSPFATNQSCLTNPDRCPNGLSFSLWTLVLYDNSVYDMIGLSDADNQYMVSTGADRDGHPGVAIGIKKQWMFALVSTGSQYWYTEILGQLQNNTWNNVGVRFSPSMGLEVYVNCTKVGSTTIINTATAKATYAIPTLLIGCQKTASDSNYSGYFNGYCDEIAIWDKLVPVTNNLSLNFFGGYSANTSNISPAEFASMLANIQINNPGQQAAAVKILTQLTATSTAPTPAPTATQGNVVSGSAASPTSAGSTAETVTTPAPASVQSLKTIGTILMNMMDPTRLPEALTPEQASSFLQLSESFSNVLGPDNSANWQVVQNQTETVGVMQLVHQFRAWHSKLMQSITYTNESKPLCNEIVNKNVYIKYCKMTICDFGILDKRYTVPDYSKPSLKEIRNLWKDTVTDRIAFPTQIFPDDRCCDRPVSFIFHYYGFADQAAVSIANPMYISSNAYTSVDARIMNLDIVSDLPYDTSGNVDTKEPLCNYDAEALLEQQLLFKSSHMDTNDAMTTPRKLLLFENQTVTDIQERFCVYWNENLTDYGAWDSPLCGMVVDTGEYSKCACSNVGIFTILAVKTEPIVVPKQSQWVYLIKYIFYGLSIFAVTIYVAVVLMSGELKDQFHLAGLHLAIAILIGSIAMVISDFAAVKDDRNTCTMVGTFIHIFYGAVGSWILFLGHASFNAITSGIIGGRLLSYSTIAWGIPLAFAGVPFITMLSLMGYDPYCFIGWDNIVKWVFFAPQMACALIASFFAIVILCNLSTPALRKENLIKDYGTFCRGAALLILYLSITWTFGLVAYIRFGIAIDFYPIFQVLNSLSGVCLLVLIGFGSERFRSTLAGKTQARRAMLRQFAFGLPNSDDIRGPKKWQSNNPSAASTSTLIPEESKIPSEELQAY